MPSFSPDGKWIAYQYAGAVYVKPFPGGGRAVQISGFRGTLSPAIWAPDGEELFVLSNAGRLFAAEFRLKPTFGVAVPPREWFRGLYASSSRGQRWDLAPDGRFLMNRESGPTRINLAVNWSEELKQRAPTGREP